LCSNFAAKRARVDVVDEGPLAVDLDHREPLSVLGLEFRATSDVDLLQLERHLRAYALDDATGPLAEVAAGCVVEDDPPHPALFDR
jgi:hypothetical protein